MTLRNSSSPKRKRKARPCPGGRPMPAAGISETYERYALGLARKERLPGARGGSRATASALRRLRRLGVKGWPERLTLYTRSLPPGCRPCLQGRASTLTLTTLCNRDCFFCFNPRPRSDVLSVHGKSAGSAREAVRLLAGLGIRSVGVSGGEPLLFPERTLRLIRNLRRDLDRALSHTEGTGGRSHIEGAVVGFASEGDACTLSHTDSPAARGAAPPRSVRIDLYTNGDLLTPSLLRRLKAAGTDSLRLNLAANGYGPGPAAMAVGVFPDLAVEIPVVPRDEAKVWRLITSLDRAKVRHIILHELFCSAQNLDRLRARGCHAVKGGPGRDVLAWSGVQGSGSACLRLVTKALAAKLRIGVYYCSTATQRWIAEKALSKKKA